MCSTHPYLASLIGSDPTLWGIFASLFILGFIGSFTHCTFMCAPFVSMQVQARLDKIPAEKATEFSRLTGSLLIPYHLGRLTTYVLLGFIAATLIGFVHFNWQNLSGYILISAALLIIFSVFFPKQTNKPLFSLPKKLNRIIHPLWQNPTGVRGYILGMILGFIPCGLLYAALTAAASTTQGSAGMIAMLGFALGTIPALFLVAFGANLGFNKFKNKIPWLNKALVSISAVWLLILGIQTLI